VVTHAHGGGSPHTHAAAVDALLALTRGERDVVLRPGPRPLPRVGSHLPSGPAPAPAGTVGGATEAPCVGLHACDGERPPSVPPPRSSARI
jgi:hypothetical protein